ncbi:hypothetical protein GCM10027359_15900 [Marilutibacter aestuarii]
MKRFVVFCMLLPTCLAVAGCAGNEARSATPPMGDIVELERHAEAAYANGRSEEASRLYRDLVEQIPGEALYWYRLGNALVRTGRQDDAAIAYQQCLKLDPGNGKAWHNLGLVRLHQAQVSFAAGVQNSDSGDRVFDESLKLSTAVFSLIAPAPGPQAGADAGEARQVERRRVEPAGAKAATGSGAGR